MSSDFGIKKWPRGVRGDNGEAPPDDDGYDEAAEHFLSVTQNQLTAGMCAFAALMAVLLAAAAYTQHDGAGDQEKTNAVKPLKK